MELITVILIVAFIVIVGFFVALSKIDQAGGNTSNLFSDISKTLKKKNEGPKTHNKSRDDE